MLDAILIARLSGARMQRAGQAPAPTILRCTWSNEAAISLTNFLIAC